MTQTEINGEIWVTKKDAELMCIDNIVHNYYIGKKVIVRSRNEGINAGIVVAADESAVIIKDCRRLWYHGPKKKNVSWYEGVAISGISDDSKVSCTSASKAIVEDYSLTECTDAAYTSIIKAKPYAKN